MAFENIKQMQMVQDVAQSPTLRDDVEIMGKEQGGLQSAPMNTQAPIPQFVPEMSQPMDIKQNLNEVLTATLQYGD